MTISVDPATYIVTIPKADLTWLGGSVYELDTNWFRLQLKDWEDSPDGIVHPRTHTHNTQVSLGGIEYARVIEILSPYTVTIENGSYVVNLIGSNNNILDVTNLNSVQIRSNNSAGLINVKELQHGIYDGAVYVDVVNGKAGTLYPIGTSLPGEQVNNIPDAIAIAGVRGFNRLKIIGNITLDTGDNIESFTLEGENAQRTLITVNEGADTLNCEIIEASVTGNLDGGSILRNCVVQDLNYVNGFVFECMLAPGIISLGGPETAQFINCFSGGSTVSHPNIDMNGVNDTGSTPLVMHNYSGYIHVKEKTGPCHCAVHLASGAVILDTTCVNGSFTVTGDGKVVDELGNHLNTGLINTNLDFSNEANYGDHVHDMWQRLGLDKDNPVTNQPDGGFTVGDIDVDAITDGNDNVVQTRQ